MQTIIVSRVTETGRVTLADRKLISTTDDGVRTEQTLVSDEQVLQALKEQFGVELDMLPRALNAKPELNPVADAIMT